MKREAKKKAFKAVPRAGQVTVEYILLAVTLIFLFHIATNAMSNSGYLDDFANRPAQVFRHAVENGNWEIDTRESGQKHPNHHRSHWTTDGLGKKYNLIRTF